ncbi:hypothetical protein HDA40_000766 [Hamadaea flava]|uniref:CU044_2847 family protein n=1 Tax=Hamadaea flava TaxID=1742688 RepID=A0ABV8LQ35_9ACTN|nr:CU044_2847 family protein [Hamadaea flava]MCP2322259.1 hypothetical protein [Hamadaea flava]
MGDQSVRTVEIELPSGRTIKAEVAMASGGDAGHGPRFRLDDVREQISAVAEFFADSVRATMPDPPRRYGVEFGIKLAVENSGLSSVLARVGAEATAVVRLEWEN